MQTQESVWGLGTIMYPRCCYVVLYLMGSVLFAGGFSSAANDYVTSIQKTLQASTETKHQQDTAG